MIIEVDKSFIKDFKKLKNKEIENRIIERLDLLEKSNNFNEIPNIKSMKGFNNFYRFRIGNYRIGFRLEQNKIILLRVRNRKDIYNIFP